MNHLRHHLTTVFRAVERKKVRQVALWVIPCMVALSAFLLVRPVFGQMTRYEERLIAQLAHDPSVVGIEKGEKGYSQVYIAFEDRKTYISHPDYPSGQVDVHDEYITWMTQIDGNWHIFLYDIYTAQSVQLTFLGNNVNPRVHNRRVVWEGWDTDVWQVFAFDGSSISKITHGGVSLKPDIEGDFVVYMQKDAEDIWRAFGYSLSKRENVSIVVSDEGEAPKLLDEEIFIESHDGYLSKFPLSIRNVFIVAENEATLDTTSSPSATLLATPAETVHTATGSVQISN